MNPVTVSIIIPSYNRSKMLRRAIQSVLNQTYPDFELIVVDDASDDDTEGTVRGLQDKRIRYIRHEKNRGGSAARNTGIRGASGEYIAFLDSDDEWVPEKLEKQITRIKPSAPSVGFVFTGFIAISDKSGKIFNRVIPQKTPNVYNRPLTANGSSILVKRECFEKVGLFDETLGSCQDWDMAIRLSRSYDFDFIPEPLVRYYHHSGELSGDLEKKIRGREAVLTKHFKDFLRYPSFLANHYNRQGILYVLSGDKVKARVFFLKSLRLKPIQKFAYLQILLLLVAPGRYLAGLKKKNTYPEGLQLFW
ncbi:MAG: glycosyltransferase [Candidatus Omnitrophota bacterium]